MQTNTKPRNFRSIRLKNDIALLIARENHNYDGAPRYEASRKMSLKIPPAVTCAPAPGPRTIRGCCLYLSVVNAMMLSDPESCANG